MPTAFVLAGGAALGAIEAGMVEALYERGIGSDFFIGTSAGGLNAGYLAARPQTVATAHELQDLWRGIRRPEVFPFSPRTFAGGLLGRRSHLFPSRGLRAVVREHVAIERIEDAPVPFAVVVTDLLSGEERVLEHGSVEDALAATSAIPGIYPPVVIDGSPCVDGGVADNTPLSQAIARGCDPIYVLPTGVQANLDQPPRGALAMGVHAATLLLHARLRDEIEELRDRATIVVLRPPWPLTVSPTDFGHADELIAASLDLARRQLAEDDPEAGATDDALRRMTPEPV